MLKVTILLYLVRSDKILERNLILQTDHTSFTILEHHSWYFVSLVIYFDLLKTTVCKYFSFQIDIIQSGV